MKIDPKEYRVETTVIDDEWQELVNVINVDIYESIMRSGRNIVSRVIDYVLVDCIIDGKVTLLFGNEEQFKFVRR